MCYVCQHMSSEKCGPTENKILVLASTLLVRIRNGISGDLHHTLGIASATRDAHPTH
jgi:hypothetical protein